MLTHSTMLNEARESLIDSVSTASSPGLTDEERELLELSPSVSSMDPDDEILRLLDEENPEVDPLRTLQDNLCCVTMNPYTSAPDALGNDLTQAAASVATPWCHFLACLACDVYS